MRKIKKRKDFLEFIPDDLFIKLATDTGDILTPAREFFENHLTAVSKQSDVKNISYYIKESEV